MPLTVYKYPVIGHKELKEFDIKMHYGASLLDFVEEATKPIKSKETEFQCVIIALVDTGEPVETRHFRVSGYGEPLDDLKNQNWAHVGSVHSVSGYAFHLFEIF